MSRITFSGYDPDPERERKERYEAESGMLRQNLTLILDNAERILSNPHHFFCQPVCSFLSTAYVAGGPIPLGILVTLWREGNLLDKCQACGGVVHIIGAGGALSMNGWWGYCAECGANQHGSKEEFWADIRVPIYRLWRRHPNHTTVRLGTHASYTHKGNRVERVQADRFIRRRIEGTPLAALIEELKQPSPPPHAHAEPPNGPAAPDDEAGHPTREATPAVGSGAGAFHFGKTTNGEPSISPRAISEGVILPPDPDLPQATHPDAPPPLVPTGLAELDRCLSGGLPSGALTYVASLWRGDATALALTIAGRHLLTRAGAVAYAACEGLEKVMATLARGRVNSKTLLSLARANAEDRAKYEAALHAVEEAPFYFIPIRQGRSMYLGDLIASVRLMQEAEPLRLLVLNNLPALKPDDTSEREPGRAVAETLQRLAATIQVPVVVALSHSGEHGTDWCGPYTPTEEDALGYTRVGTDACLLLGRLPLTTYRVRRFTITINVASHPLANAGGVTHYYFDRFTKNLHELELPGDST